MQRRTLHNQLVDLKGAIRVFCRVRPLSAAEMAAGQVPATSCDLLSNTIELVATRWAASGTEHQLQETRAAGSLPCCGRTACRSMLQRDRLAQPPCLHALACGARKQALVLQADLCAATAML